MFLCKICESYFKKNYSGTHLKKVHNLSGNDYRLIEIKSSYYFEKFKEKVLKKAEAATQWSRDNDFLPYTLLIEEFKIPIDI